MDDAPPNPTPFLPVVRYMTVSDDLRIDPTNPQLLDVVGLLYAIHSVDVPAFPMLYPELCVFLAITDCRGQGVGQIVVENDDTGELLFRSATHPIRFGNDPLLVVGVRFRLRECPFPRPGMHTIQFWYNGIRVDQRFLRVR